MASASGSSAAAMELGATTRDPAPAAPRRRLGQIGEELRQLAARLRGVGGLDAPLELGDVEPAVARVYAQALDHPSRSACEARTLPSRSPRSSPVQLAYSDLR